MNRKWVCPFEETCPGYWCDKCMETLKRIKKRKKVNRNE